MEKIEKIISDGLLIVLKKSFDIEAKESQLVLQKTKKEFEGSFTLVVFPFLKEAKMSPEMLGEKIGSELINMVGEIDSYNVVKGFLNLTISTDYWKQTLNDISVTKNFGFSAQDSKPAVMVEYSSPNTNKPLHLGHLRNNFLGYSVAEIKKANGHEVSKVQIINDRGIHICKSMLAWQKFGGGETPESSGIKGDKLVGKYYVAFDKQYKSEIAELIVQGKDKDYAEKNAPSMLEARDILLKWENKDQEVFALWEKMNSWVYKGFEQTYKAMGVDFDKNYYESETYLLGKQVIMDGLAKGVFEQQEDGSIWVDLTAEGLDRKILLRSDGTAVYMTQDIGTAIKRFEDFPGLSSQIYTVGNEQDYHFKVLFIILKKLGYSWADNCHHLSYGMVDLPEGKMKSREGTVVDADDLMNEMSLTAKSITEELGKLDGLENKEELYDVIGLGALKYYLLKVDPKKRLLFNPAESIDFNGNTGPFIQYTHARIRSLIDKFDQEIPEVDESSPCNESELKLIEVIYEFPETIKNASDSYSPALVANYMYSLVKTFNSFYQNSNIMKEEDKGIQGNRMVLVSVTGDLIKRGMALLGITVPEQM
ncbi:MAG: arginyl-tRNA synthetase [Patiriisocius sp.]|jgi:arginyl-tRNA synthetase